MFLNIYYFNSLLALSVLILVMYYKKFKFLCINLENGICALKMQGNIFQSFYHVKGKFMIIWKSIELCYIVKILVTREK